MKSFFLAILLLVMALPLKAQSLPPIDWGSAGKGEATPPKSMLPAPEPEKPALPDSGFECGTVTRLSMEQDRIFPDSGNGMPKQVKRCSRDGFSLEVTPPQP
jgi:hypothetical protein